MLTKLYNELKIIIKNYDDYYSKDKQCLNYQDTVELDKYLIALVGNVFIIKHRNPITNSVTMDVVIIDEIKKVIDNEDTFQNFILSLDGTQKVNEFTNIKVEENQVGADVDDICKEKRFKRLVNTILDFMLGMATTYLIYQMLY